MQWQIWGYANSFYIREQRLFFWASTSVIAFLQQLKFGMMAKKNACKEDEGSREGGNELLQSAVREKNKLWFHFNCLLRYKAGTLTQETCALISRLS